MISTVSNRLSAKILTLSVGFYVTMYYYEKGERFTKNPLHKSNTTEMQRAKQLSKFIDLLPSDRTDLRFQDKEGDTAFPVGFDSGETPEYDGREAINAIARGSTGVCLPWDSKEHGTAGLVCYDVDRRQYLPGELQPSAEEFDSSVRIPDTSDVPLTLEIMSGSGARHFVYRTDGTVRAKKYGLMDRMNVAGGFTVAPGSTHETGGVYHVHEKRPIATLSADDLPDALRA